MPSQLSEQRKAVVHHLVFLAVILGATFFFGARFLDERLGIRDFGGAAAWVWETTSWFNGDRPFSLWIGDFFCGQPLVMIWTTLLWFLMYAPFALLFGAVLGLKVGILFYLAMAGFTCFALVRWYLRAWWPAWLAGIAYALHPIHVDLSGEWGLTNFAVFYPWVPLLAMLLVMLARKPTRRLVALTALVVAAAFWADFQRPFVTFPFLAALYIFELARVSAPNSHPWKAFGKGLLPAIAAALLGMLLVAFAIVPAVVQQKDCTLIPKDEIPRENVASSLHNPLYPFDANREITRSLAKVLPPDMQRNAGTYYMGLVSIVVGLLALFVSRDRAHKATLVLFFLLALAAYCVACGVYSPYQTWARFLGAILNNPLDAWRVPVFVWLVAVVVIGAPVVLLVAVRRRRERIREWALIVAPLVAALFLFGKPFVWLVRYVPLYANMRSPTWFASVIPSFASACLIGFGAHALAARVRHDELKRFVYVVVLILTLLDIAPYRSRLDIDILYAREFGDSRVNPGAELAQVADFMTAQGKDGRWITADPYSPLCDAAIAYCGRPAAWSWLHWSSARGYGRLFEDRTNGVFANLMRPQGVARATRLLGVANVRYVIGSPVYMQNRAVFTGDALPRVFAAGNWILMENPAYRPFVQAYAHGANAHGAKAHGAKAHEPSALKANALKANALKAKALKAEGQGPPAVADRDMLEGVSVTELTRAPGRIGFQVDLPQDALVVVSEAVYPTWQASIDGAPAEIVPAEDAFLALDVPKGAHQVALRSTVPCSYKAGLALSVAGLIIAAALFFKKREGPKP